MRLVTAVTVLMLSAGSASVALADLAKIDSRSDFIKLVEGKTLSRPFIKLEVSPAGTITGRGARWDVTGSWSWQEGYFCRDLIWGGDALPYNCQEVRANGTKVRFTSDKGTGDSAEFKLQ